MSCQNFKKNESEDKVKISTPKYESYLKNNLNFEDFIYENMVYDAETVIVYKVQNKKNSDLYADKMIPLRANQTEESIRNEINFFELFHQMPEIPNFFPKYYGYVIEISMFKQKTFHIYFKYYPKTLRDIIKSKKFSDDYKKIQDYYYQIVNGLAFLETYGIAHRDVKPENILLDEKELKIFIADFNIAVKIKDLPQKPSKFCGTMGYRSPQWVKNDLNGSLVDPLKADCFSLGLILLEMAGIQNNLQNTINYQSFLENLNAMIMEFENKFKNEIKNDKTDSNRLFFEDIKGNLQEYPDQRKSFTEIFIGNFKSKSKNLDKLKFHIFVQDISCKEIQQPNKKQKDDLEILNGIYATLNNFFICEVGPKAEVFKKKTLKHMKILNELEALADINNLNPRLKSMYTKAMLFKGILYEFGINTLQDPAKAKNCYEKSIKDPYSLYKFGLGVSGPKAFESHKNSADLGNSYGIYKLGYCYDKGIGIKKDQNKAFEFYEKSANLGNALGNYYKNKNNYRFL